MQRRFRQVDVFTDRAYLGNPVAVVLDADGLDAGTMQLVARWTNLSETTFVVTPTTNDADYGVRIFTPVAELPFAGHPTLGTCHAWMEAGGRPAGEDVVVQECPAGLIRVRVGTDHPAFAAPPLLRSGPADDAVVAELVDVLGLDADDLLAVEWVDNGPGWVAVLLRSAEAVLAVRPGYADRSIGVVGPHPAGAPAAVEVRAFFAKDATLVEDPVTGSLNASLGQWLTSTGRITAPYIAAQGTQLGRVGLVHVSLDDDGQVWVGGGTITCVEGEIEV